MRATCMATLALTLVLAGGGTAPASSVPAVATGMQGFDHYQVILDRQPFGRPPEPPAAVVAPEAAKLAQAEQVLAKQIRLSVLTRTKQGVAAGLIDSSTTPPKNLYLYVGGTEAGITLVSADVEAETAEISKDGATLVFTLTGVKMPAVLTPPAAGMAGLPPPRAPSPFSPPAVPAAPFRLSPRPTPVPVAPSPGSVSTSTNATATYIERLRMRREELQASNAANLAGMNKTTEKLVTEAAQAALRKRNMDMIRRGEGSLGIALTPEEDAQLVREGVLPAAQ